MLKTAIATLFLIACRPAEKCDEGAAARGSWVTDRDPTDRDGFSPGARGFRAEGRCNTTISDKILDCASSEVRGIHGDSPILRRALGLGFTTYVCELAGSGKRTEYALASVLSAAPVPAPSVPDCAGMAIGAVSGIPDDTKARVREVYARRCTEDKWPADVIRCYTEAAGMPGLQACRAKLPPDLGTKLRGEVMAAVAKSQPKPVPAPQSARAARCERMAVRAVAPLALAPDVIQELGPVYAKHCTEDGWSDALIACYEASEFHNQTLACGDKLPREQAMKFFTELQVVLARGLPEAGSGS